MHEYIHTKKNNHQYVLKTAGFLHLIDVNIFFLNCPFKETMLNEQHFGEKLLVFIFLALIL